MTIEEFNSLDDYQAFQLLFKCCGCTRWANQLTAKRPFKNIADLKIQSDEIWKSMSVEDVLEAFTHHPKIGDVKLLEKKFNSTKEWASNEQSGVTEASLNVIEKLAELNEKYENKFGYIFIVCATGKSAKEMLDLLSIRMENLPEEELMIAATEQNKITHLRIDKLFS